MGDAKNSSNQLADELFTYLALSELKIEFGPGLFGVLPREIVHLIMLALPPLYTLGWDTSPLNRPLPEVMDAMLARQYTRELGRSGQWSNSNLTFTTTGIDFVNRYMVAEPIKYPYILSVEYALLIVAIFEFVQFCLLSFVFMV
jgi:hypothetical protein